MGGVFLLWCKRVRGCLGVNTVKYIYIYIGSMVPRKNGSMVPRKIGSMVPRDQNIWEIRIIPPPYQV